VRIDYSDDEQFGGQFFLWQANCERSMRGKIGQRELRALEAALVVLPQQRLIAGTLQEDGEVCAVACYALHKGVDLAQFPSEYDSDEVGMAGGMPHLVAWKVVEMNDLAFEGLTPEQRYTAMLRWVRAQLTPGEERAKCQ
jgi:hypothetical protein